MGRSEQPRETLGALLARVRGEQGISQLRLAERLCAASGLPTVTRHEVSRWEREERIPTGYWLGWLGAVLDVPLPELERAAAAARATRRRPPAPAVPDHRTPVPRPVPRPVPGPVPVPVPGQGPGPGLRREFGPESDSESKSARRVWLGPGVYHRAS